VENSANYRDVWTKPQYIQTKIDVFHLVDTYLRRPVRRILDIGCGYARTSQCFQEKYNTDLWLLDGDIGDSPGHRIGKWGSVDSFQYYLTEDQLREYWDGQGMRYHYVNGARPNIPEDIKFDLVYSWASCGFHYPVSVYKDLIKRHTDSNSVVIMEFRKGIIDQQIEDFDIVANLEPGNEGKRQKLHIRLR